MRPRQDGRHFPDDNFKCIFLNEDVWIMIKISLNFVSKDPINNIPALVQIMAWRRPGDKLLSEPMMVSLLTHICVTGPQCVNTSEGTPIIKIKWSDYSLIFIMEILIPGKTVFILKRGPVLSVIIWSICPYYSWLFHWHWDDDMVTPMPIKLSWKILVKSSII